ncbi:MAG: TIGR04452 family lipoprotein [Leptospira sp.]|nr:TIGR04452 family lipoprotein [Leptospira sp.]
MNTIKTILLLIFVWLVNCNYIYSPTGIRGSDARAEIDEVKQTTGFISLPLLSSSVSSVSGSGQTSNATCSVKSDAISSSNSPTSTANITVPPVNSSVDMNHTTGTGYFRTNPFNNLQVGQIVLFRQITGNTGDCSFNYGPTACETTDITTLTDPTNVERENNSRINFDEDTANNCLAIRCNAPAAIRLRTTTSGSATASVEFDTVGFIVSPILFESLTEINDDRYYTKDSVESCKENISLLSLIQFSETQRAFQAYSAQDALATSCNENNPSFSPPSNLLISLLQGSLCSIEEVGFFGIF